ncbi:MAG: hypothetical protein AAFZ07_20240 [Actinomycetota bacterium]
MPNRIHGSLIEPLSMNESVFAPGTAIPAANLAQAADRAHPVRLTDLLVWDDFTARLPAAAANDDLGLVTGTWGTHVPTVQAGDLKGVGATTRRAGFLWPLPPNYDLAQSLSCRIRAGMQTTVADNACTLDLEVFLVGQDGNVDGADLYADPAIDVNQLAEADREFELTGSGLSERGLVLMGRISLTCNDAATGTAVTPTIYSVSMLVDTRG